MNTAQSAQLKRKIEAEAPGQEVEKLYLDWLLDEALRETERCDCNRRRACSGERERKKTQKGGTSLTR